MKLNLRRSIAIVMIAAIVLTFTSIPAFAAVSNSTLTGEDVTVELGATTVDVNVVFDVEGEGTFDMVFFKAVPDAGLTMKSVKIPEEYAQYGDLADDCYPENNVVWISQNEYEQEYVAAPTATFVITYEIENPNIDKSYRINICEEAADFDLGDCMKVSVVKDAIVTVGAGSELPPEVEEEEEDDKPSVDVTNPVTPTPDKPYVPYKPKADTVISVANGEYNGKTLKVGDEFTVPVTVNEFPERTIYSVDIKLDFNKSIIEFVGLENKMHAVANDTDVLENAATWTVTDTAKANKTGRIIASYLDKTKGSKSFGPKSLSGSASTMFELKFKVLNTSVNTLVDVVSADLVAYADENEVAFSTADEKITAKDGKILFADGLIILVPGTTAPEAKPETKPEDEPEDKPEVKPEVKKFTDLKGFEWAEEAVYALVEKGIVNGKTETSYEPEANVTRAEFAKLVVAAFNMTLKGEGVAYTDVKESDWFYEYVAIASSNGIVKGYEDNTFLPEENITREEMCVMLERALKGIGLETKDSTFADNDKISDWAKSAVSLLSANGIINGMPDNTFVPQGTATRAESAVAIYRTIKNAIEK